MKSERLLDVALEVIEDVLRNDRPGIDGLVLYEAFPLLGPDRILHVVAGFRCEDESNGKVAVATDGLPLAAFTREAFRDRVLHALDEMMFLRISTEESQRGQHPSLGGGESGDGENG